MYPYTHPESLVRFHLPKETDGKCPREEMEYEERNPTCTANLLHQQPKHIIHIVLTITR
jgi:hypothetical protein